MAKIPATIELNPAGGEPKASVIWLHGLGASGNDFEALPERFPALQSKVRYVFPHAPVRPIMVNGGMEMRAWYDIEEIDIDTDEDEAGIKDSEQLIHLLIEHEIKLGIPAEKIILAGFSQGAAMSLYAGLRYPQRLGGIIALSGYLPLASSLEKEKHAANQNIPIFLAHGVYDPMVPYVLGQNTKMLLEKSNYPVAWHFYFMEHSVISEEVEDIYRFLQSVV